MATFGLDTNFFSNILNPDLSKKNQITSNTSNVSTVTNANTSNFTNTKNLSLILNSPNASSGLTNYTPSTLTPSLSVVPSVSQSAIPSFTSGTETQPNIFNYLLVGGLVIGGIILIPSLIKK